MQAHGQREDENYRPLAASNLQVVGALTGDEGADVFQLKNRRTVGHPLSPHRDIPHSASVEVPGWKVNKNHGAWSPH